MARPTRAAPPVTSARLPRRGVGGREGMAPKRITPRLTARRTAPKVRAGMGKKKRKAQGASEAGNAGPDPAEGGGAPVASAEAQGTAEAPGPAAALPPLSAAPRPLERPAPASLGGVLWGCVRDPRH